MDRYRLRGHRVGSGMPRPTRYARMRDGRLERFCSTLCPGSLRMPGHFCVVRMRLLLEPGQKEQKPRPLSLPTGAKESRGKEISGSPSAQHGHNAAVLRRDVPYLRRSAQRAEASGCGHEPDDFVPFEARPARRASPFELRGRAQKVRFTPRYPLPSPAGETSFYPASAIKGAKPRPLSLS